MSQPTPEGGEIDSRLEELDRRLRAVQDELLPEREPRRVRGVEDAPGPPPGPPPEPEPPPPPPPRPAAVTAVHTKLVSSLRELLGAYESLLDQFSPVDPGRPPSPAPPPPPAPEPQTIAAGPFPTTDAVRVFRDALAALPGVETVVIRAYEGQDRAVFDVKLTGPQLPGGSA